MTELAERLSDILGPKGWIPAADARPWTRDWLDRYGAPPLGVARPAATAEVSAVLAAAHAAGVPVVPQGGNTGLCGGAVLGAPGGVILSLARMAARGEPDAASGSIEVEAGLVLQALHEALDGSGLMFPMHLGAEGSAQIGGLIGTNAGGSHAFRFGMMQDLVLGLEVVLADGTVWNGLRAVQKDNAGYQLRRLFCGSEGTLGVVTRAVLKLHPAPRQRATALLVLPDAAATVAFGTRLRAEAGDVLTGLEFFSEIGLELALRHIPALSYPLGTRGGCYLLVEVASASDCMPLEDILSATLEWGMGEGLVLDGTIAASQAQRAAFWRLREEQPEGQRLEGAQLKHDVAVPPGRIAEFLRAAGALCERLLPGVRVNPFGHLADGNVHYNLSPPEGAADFDGRAGEIGLAVARLATGMGGSFAAEHGLGQAKAGLADTLRSPEERRLMRALRRALDPGETLNPWALAPADGG
ncbi:FAD-binding oxidoreductase [Aureimonas flava]|uniref:FAD-binding oxidoreductase n=1 Tax=Aureimonas flava TaxID=2320271 RepID=A0A3A1WMI9_9HYPH|nr:FAD-binding oxidoreductase [Aureimonas flava]RIY00947.1 FAD-binding oxidoreductase [Aureimonas flava]